MSFLDKLRDTLIGQRVCSPEHLAGYKRIGEQVYEVEVELADSQNSKATAIFQAAKCFQVMADALIRDAFPSGGNESKPVPVVTHEQAEAWYGRIPDLLVAVRQEAVFPGSAKITLPIRMGNRIELSGPCPVQHLAGMRRAADELESVFKERMDRIRLHGDKFKKVILFYEEARTRRQVGDAIVGSILRGQHVPAESHEEAEEQYWTTLSSYLLVAQGLEDPFILEYSPVNFGRDSQGGAEPVRNSNSGDILSVSPQAHNFQHMEQQANMIQQHNGNIVSQLQQTVNNIQALNVDEAQKQSIVYALRELALSVKGLNQETMGLVQNMAMYIQKLEAEHPQSQQVQQKYPQQYQQQVTGNTGSGLFGGKRGGFWDTILQTAEMGAGFAIGEEIVEDIFGNF